LTGILKIIFSLDVAKGLEYLHSHNPKIIHRDLKPANCLVDKNWAVKISDFGLSTIKSRVEYTMTSVGTPTYMAPEVILKSRYSESADIYSLGILFYEIFSTSQPYQDKNIKNVMQLMNAIASEDLRPTLPEALSPALRQLLTECWDGEAENRPCATEIVKRIKRIGRQYQIDIQDSKMKIKSMRKSNIPVSISTPTGNNSTRNNVDLLINE